MRYLISFPSAAMDVSGDELPAVADAAHAVIRDAREAGVYVFGGGLNEDVAPVLGGRRRHGQRRRLPRAGRRMAGPRRALAGGGAALGRQGRSGLPLPAGGARVPVRSARLIEGRGCVCTHGAPMAACTSGQEPTRPPPRRQELFAGTVSARARRNAEATPAGFSHGIRWPASGTIST